MFQVPPDIAAIFAKPGRTWTEDQYSRVWEWLNSAPQLEYFLTFSLRHLGTGASWEDAEDAWGDFGVEKLEGVVESFDPAKRVFAGYLLLCLKRFCWSRGPRVRGGPIVRPTGIEFGDLIDLTPSETDDPEGPDDLPLFQECINALPPKYRAVVRLRYLEQYKVNEVADKLGISENLASVWLHRALPRLKKCMEDKGFGL